MRLVSLIDATIYFFLVFLLLMKCCNPLVTVLSFRDEPRISFFLERLRRHRGRLGNLGVRRVIYN
jgi:hypothetical protein